MKAIQMSHFESPGPGPGQVLVRVRAAGADPDDTLMRKNRYAMTPPLPSVPGSQAAGLIEGFGAGVNGPTIGRLCGIGTRSHRSLSRQTAPRKAKWCSSMPHGGLA